MNITEENQGRSCISCFRRVVNNQSVAVGSSACLLLLYFMQLFILKKQMSQAHLPVRVSLWHFHLPDAMYLTSSQPLYRARWVFSLRALRVPGLPALCARAASLGAAPVSPHDAPRVLQQSKRRSCCLAQEQVTAFGSPAVTCSCER